MSERYHTIPRTLCLVMHEGKLLLIEYAERKGAMHGFYNALGGHIEAGEGIIESAKREILEEAGLRVRNTRLKGIAHVTNFFGKNVMMFVTQSETDSVEVTESDEGKLHWVGLDELDQINLIGDIRTILEHVIENGEGGMFTSVNEFDGGGKLLKVTFE